MHIRDEQTGDIDAIRQITTEAFRGLAYSSQTEAAIVDALRAAGALKVSLVAVENEAVVGHIAFSPVAIDGRDLGWFGLGPVSVRPDRQRAGIGKALIGDGLKRLRALGAKGCVLLGDPGYYRKFGFENDAGLRYEGPPPEYFMRLAFEEPAPSGAVAFHKGFEAT